MAEGDEPQRFLRKTSADKHHPRTADIPRSGSDPVIEQVGFFLLQEIGNVPSCDAQRVFYRPRLWKLRASEALQVLLRHLPELRPGYTNNATGTSAHAGAASPRDP